MMDVSEDLYPSHDNRTVDTPLGGADIWPYQQFDRATDRADGSASVAGAAATPSARQLGSSTDSCSEPGIHRNKQRMFIAASPDLDTYPRHNECPLKAIVRN